MKMNSIFKCNGIIVFFTLVIVCLHILHAPLHAVEVISNGQQETQVQLAPLNGNSSCAYANIALLADGRLLCVYSTWENPSRDRVVIMGIVSSDNGKTWNEPITLIDESPDLSYDPNITVIGDTILVCSTTVPPTHSKYVSTSRIMSVRSDDNGHTWSKSSQIHIAHRYVAGKIHRGLALDDSSALFGFAWDKGLETKKTIAGDNEQICIVSWMITKDKGRTWEQGPDLSTNQKRASTNAVDGLDEPAYARCPDGSIFMLCRTGFDKMFESSSPDNGKTWSDPKPSPFTSHNAPASLCEIKGQRPGILAVWDNSPVNRWPLCAAASFDNGHTWTEPRILANHSNFQSSYSSCVQAADGSLVVVWLQEHPDRQSTIELTRFDLDWLLRIRKDGNK